MLFAFHINLHHTSWWSLSKMSLFIQPIPFSSLFSGNLMVKSIVFQQHFVARDSRKNSAGSWNYLSPCRQIKEVSVNWFTMCFQVFLLGFLPLLGQNGFINGGGGVKLRFNGINSIEAFSFYLTFYSLACHIWHIYPKFRL